MSNYSLILDIHFSGKSWSLKGDDYEGLEWSDTTTKPTQDELDALWEPLKASINANAYKDKRAAAYPSIADQLDTIYHSGIDAWKETITAVKEAHPK